MIALEDDSYTRALREMGERYESASAAVIVSAHWQRTGPIRVTAWEQAPIIHDFGGFPQELFKLEYPAPGAPQLAGEIAATLASAGHAAELDHHRGLDHGAWIPARLIWPSAKIPVIQLSLPAAEPAELFEIGRALRPFREQKVLLIGSGGIVHNLRRVRFGHELGPVDRWAEEFDRWVEAQLESGETEALFGYRELAPGADSAVPTTEHFDPLFVTMGTRLDGDRVTTIYEGFRYGNISMRSFLFSRESSPTA
jgi:4,5-DOPA dioxygenase extradiol